MRCKCCNRMDSNPVLGDWYCSVCERSIRKAMGEEFTLEDLYGIIEGEANDDRTYINTR